MTLLTFIAGLLALVAGGEMLVRGASRLAAAVGVSPLVIGLTVVAFGTSSPEAAVALKASLSGQPDIALGNAVGSNICNVLLILGLSACVAPLVVARQLVRLDVPLMIGVSLALLLLSLDGRISSVDGAIFVTALVVYITWSIVSSRRESSVANEGHDPGGGARPSSARYVLYIGFIVGGLVLLTVGSNWLVSSAVIIARAWQVSELVIALTIVALGTSLPELTTSVIASVRGERDLAVGNVVGSNIFNILFVLGVSASVAPRGIEVSQAALGFDIPIMIAVAVACLPIFFTDHLIARWEGTLFLFYYGAYTAYLILAGAQHEALQGFNALMIYFVMPITGVTVVLLGVRAYRSQS